MSTPGQPRWPAGPSEPAGLGERLAVIALAGVLTAALACWAVVELAARLFGTRASSISVADAISGTLRLPGHLADPRQAWPAAVRAHLPGPIGFYAAGLLVLGGLGVLSLLGAVLVSRLRGLPSARRRQPGQGAQWAQGRDLRPLTVRGPVAGRLVLGRAGGRLLAAEARQSAIVIAPTQSLKTTGLAVPALLEWQGPVLATSVKTDLMRDTIAHRRTRGDVLVFDPIETTGIDAQGWSPLSGCGSWHGAQRTAAALCAAAKPGSATLADPDFWYAAAAKLLAPLLFAAATVAEGSMADVVRWTDTQEIDEVRDALDQTRSSEALQAAQATWGRDETPCVNPCWRGVG